MYKFKIAAYSIVLFGAVSLSTALAENQVYRCVVNDNTIFTDTPCDAPKLTGVKGPNASVGGGPSGQDIQPGKSIALDYSTPYGLWRGQGQYQATSKSQPIGEAHAVIPLVIQVEEQGRVRGASAENGCKMLGVAAPYVTPMILTLDVTLSECRYRYFNRRYFGSLVLSKADNQVRLSLQSYNLARDKNGGDHFDLKATMRR